MIYNTVAQVEVKSRIGNFQLHSFKKIMYTLGHIDPKPLSHSDIVQTGY